MSATPTWAARVEAYLAYRRSFGFELSIEGGQLGSFARFADQRGAERLTLEL
ncbi:integrase, partial [Prevotella copri]|nr:integrase [Segatella copri]